jgi:hypothetical protein
MTVTKPVTGPLQLTSLIILSIRTDRLGDRRYLHHHSLHYLGRHQFDAHRFFDFLNAAEQISHRGSGSALDPYSIGSLNPEPDPAEKMTRKTEKIKKCHVFEVLLVSLWRLEASSVAWKSFMKA